MKKLLYCTLALLFLCLNGGASPLNAGIQAQRRIPAVSNSDILKLLSALNLDRPGLEKVKGSINDPREAANELLMYYRSRDFVKHPVDRKEKPVKGPSERDLKVAEDALNHIFIGQSAYPPYFCGEDINWLSKPVPDREWVVQLNRMGFWQTMATVYRQTGDEKYAREWAFQLVDWTRKNPRDKAHEDAWRSIEAGIRGNGWTNLFQGFLDSPSFTIDVMVPFLNSFHEHAVFLMTKYSKGSNWSLMEADGLAYIALTFPEFIESDAWVKEAARRLNAEITNQVYPDGHQKELAISYHMGCIGDFASSYNMALMNGRKDLFPESYQKTIEKMCEIPMKLGFPDGTNPAFSDAWSGNPGYLWRSLYNWGKKYNREDFLYVATEGKEGKKPEQTAFALETSGLYSMRSSWNKNAICLILKCGPDGGWHCQPDNGTFEIYAGGRHLTPDGGSFIYSGDNEGRAWFRQTKVHQTLTLDGKNSAYAPKLLLWKPGNDLDVLVVENAGYPGLTHRRAVFFVDKKYFVFVDEANGDATGDVDLHFQLAPGKTATDEKKFSVRSDFPEGWNLLIQTAPQKNMSIKKEEGQVSFVYTKKEPRPAFCFSVPKTTKEGVRFVTVVAPYEKEQPVVSAKLLGKPVIGSSHVELEVSFDGKKRKISYDL